MPPTKQRKARMKARATHSERSAARSSDRLTACNGAAGQQWRAVRISISSFSFTAANALGRVRCMSKNAWASILADVIAF